MMPTTISAIGEEDLRITLTHQELYSLNCINTFILFLEHIGPYLLRVEPTRKSPVLLYMLFLAEHDAIVTVL